MIGLVAARPTCLIPASLTPHEQKRGHTIAPSPAITQRLGNDQAAKRGLSRDLNPGPATFTVLRTRAEEPEAAIMRLDH